MPAPVSSAALVIAVAVAAVAQFAAALSARTEAFPETFYGYALINETYGANMFYGISGDSNATFRGARSTPLVMWLQGGPGATSLFGSFLENGPVKLELDPSSDLGFTLTPRVHRWTKHANMLYVDNPIGTGFSYTVDPSGFATTDERIAADLVTFMRQFLIRHPEYNGRDFWVFCESYGGKMTAYFGAALARVQEGSSPLPINFKGVSIGDGWVDPISCMKSYGTYLQTVSQLTPGQVAASDRYADLAEDALEEGNGNAATYWWGTQQDYIGNLTANINWYNWGYYYDYTADNQLNVFLALNFTSEYLSIINPAYPYDNQSNLVFDYMGDAFMRDGVSQIDELIQKGYSVNVEAGQMDLIVDVRCIEDWIAKLRWHGLPEWLKASTREPVYPANQSFGFNVGAFRQNYQNFTLWQIMKAGHMIPLDNPAMAETMFVWIIGGNMTKVDPHNPPPPPNPELEVEQQGQRRGQALFSRRPHRRLRFRSSP